MQKEKNWGTDIVLGTIFIVFGIAVYLATLNLTASTYDPLGPAFMPRTLGILITLTAIVILYHGIRKKIAITGVEESSGKPDEILPFTKHPLIALTGMVLTFAYILALDLGLSGFRTLTMLYVLLLGGILIKAEKGGKLLKKFVVLVIIALVMSFGLFYLFTQVFTVNLY
jgi:hypothetical protein